MSIPSGSYRIWPGVALVTRYGDQRGNLSKILLNRGGINPLRYQADTKHNTLVGG